MALHYRVHSTKVRRERLYPTRTEAIAAFERKCKRAGIQPPERYPPGVSGDNVTNNDIAYPRRTRACGLSDGHSWVYVEKKHATQEAVECTESSPGSRYCTAAPCLFILAIGFYPRERFISNHTPARESVSDDDQEYVWVWNADLIDDFYKKNRTARSKLKCAVSPSVLPIEQVLGTAQNYAHKLITIHGCYFEGEEYEAVGPCGDEWPYGTEGVTMIGLFDTGGGFGHLGMYQHQFVMVDVPRIKVAYGGPPWADLSETNLSGSDLSHRYCHHQSVLLIIRSIKTVFADHMFARIQDMSSTLAATEKAGLFSAWKKWTSTSTLFDQRASVSAGIPSGKFQNKVDAFGLRHCGQAGQPMPMPESPPVR